MVGAMITYTKQEVACRRFGELGKEWLQIFERSLGKEIVQRACQFEGGVG